MSHCKHQTYELTLSQLNTTPEEATLVSEGLIVVTEEVIMAQEQETFFVTIANARAMQVPYAV